MTDIDRDNSNPDEAGDGQDRAAGPGDSAPPPVADTPGAGETSASPDAPASPAQSETPGSSDVPEAGGPSSFSESTYDGGTPDVPVEGGFSQAHAGGDPSAASYVTDRPDVTQEMAAPQPSGEGETTDLAGGSQARLEPQEQRPEKAGEKRLQAEENDDDEETAMEATKMTLGEHLEELRKRIIYSLVGLVLAMILTLAFGKWLLLFLQKPYHDSMKALGMDAKLAVLSPTAGFGTFFQVTLIAGLVVSSGWIFYQLWMFVSAGLYKHERRYVMHSVPFSAGLFVLGALFFLFVASKPMLLFLFGFNQWLDLAGMITLDNYISFVTNMMLMFGLAFQTPLVVFVLGKIGLLSMKTLRHYRRHVIIVILLVAAMITPSPSPIDQMVLAIPMYMLFELGVLLLWLSQRKTRRLEAEPRD